jgi:hypothetical protein
MSKRKRYLKKKDLARRYRNCIKTVERMWKDGRIPEPDIWNAKSPLWSEESLEKHERITMAASTRRSS